MDAEPLGTARRERPDHRDEDRDCWSERRNVTQSRSASIAAGHARERTPLEREIDDVRPDDPRTHSNDPDGREPQDAPHPLVARPTSAPTIARPADREHAPRRRSRLRRDAPSDDPMCPTRTRDDVPATAAAAPAYPRISTSVSADRERPRPMSASWHLPRWSVWPHRGWCGRRSARLPGVGLGRGTARSREDLVELAEHLFRHLDAPARASSRAAASVRGPMIGAVTAGWWSSHASATSAGRSPSSLQSVSHCSSFGRFYSISPCM